MAKLVESFIPYMAAEAVFKLPKISCKKTEAVFKLPRISCKKTFVTPSFKNLLFASQESILVVSNHKVTFGKGPYQTQPLTYLTPSLT